MESLIALGAVWCKKSEQLLKINIVENVLKN